MIPMLPAFGCAPDVSLVEINSRHHVCDRHQWSVNAVIRDQQLLRFHPWQVKQFERFMDSTEIITHVATDDHRTTKRVQHSQTVLKQTTAIGDEYDRKPDVMQLTNVGDDMIGQAPATVEVSEKGDAFG